MREGFVERTPPSYLCLSHVTLPAIALYTQLSPVTAVFAVGHVEMKFVQQVSKHLFDMLITVCLDQFALIFIVIQQTNGFVEKDVQALLNCLTGII